MVQFITNEKFIDLRWVFSEKYINGEPNVKVRWLPRGSKKIALLFYVIQLYIAKKVCAWY